MDASVDFSLVVLTTDCGNTNLIQIENLRTKMEIEKVCRPKWDQNDTLRTIFFFVRFILLFAFLISGYYLCLVLHFCSFHKFMLLLIVLVSQADLYLCVSDFLKSDCLTGFLSSNRHLDLSLGLSYESPYI